MVTVTSTPDEPLPLLTVPQVATRLGLSTRAVHRLLSDGELPFVQVTASARRVDPDDLHRFIQARRCGIH